MQHRAHRRLLKLILRLLVLKWKTLRTVLSADYFFSGQPLYLAKFLKFNPGSLFRVKLKVSPLIKDAFVMVEMKFLHRMALGKAFQEANPPNNWTIV